MNEMMSRQLTDNRLLQYTAGSDITVSTGSAMSAIFSQDMMTGLIGSSIDRVQAQKESFTREQLLSVREGERLRLQEEDLLTFSLQNDLALTDFDRDEMGLRLQEITRERDAVNAMAVAESVREGRMETPESLTEQYSDLGLEFDRPMAPSEAALLAEGKREELLRNAIIQRSPEGFLPGVAKFVAGLAAVATDPLEIASMFIPVVGQVGKARAIAQFGRVGGRVAVGATEGLVGSIITEPLYYGLSSAAQLDYDMSDALLNIGLGAVFGGGIGLTAGGISFARGADPYAPRVDTPDRVDISRQSEPLTLSRDMRVDVGARERADVALRQFVNDQPVNVAPMHLQADVPQSNGVPMKFEEWNLGNKVVDQTGAPVHLYHGAGEAFEAFDTSRAGQNFGDDAGIFLTSDPAKARQYANVAKYAGDGEGRVLESYATIKDPLYVNSGDVAPDVHWIKSVERGDAPDLGAHDGVIVRAGNGEMMAVVPNPDQVFITNGKPKPQAVKQEIAARVAENAQRTDPVAEKASRAYDEVAEADTASETFVREEIEMNQRMVDQMDLTPEQRATLDEIAEIETKAKAYANIAEVAAICMART